MTRRSKSSKTRSLIWQLRAMRKLLGGMLICISVACTGREPDPLNTGRTSLIKRSVRTLGSRDTAKLTQRGAFQSGWPRYCSLFSAVHLRSGALEVFYLKGFGLGRPGEAFAC